MAKPRNFRFVDAVDFDRSYESIKCSIRQFHPPIKAFQENVYRIRAMLLMQGFTVCMAQRWQACADRSLRSRGKLDDNSDWTTMKPSKEMDREVNKDFAARIKGITEDQWDSELNRGMKLFENFARTKTLSGTIPNEGAVEFLLSSSIVQAWTAFESLATDLWIGAVNLHPRGLAELKGKSGVLGRKERHDTSDQQREMKKVTLKALHDFTRGTYRIGNAMGDLLSERFKFSALEDIREAYGLAFYRNASDIEKALSDKSLDAVSLVRNLLVHKGGRTDKKYNERAKHVPLAPTRTLHGRLVIDGIVVSGMLSKTVQASLSLIRGIEQWLLKENPKLMPHRK